MPRLHFLQRLCVGLSAAIVGSLGTASAAKPLTVVDSLTTTRVLMTSVTGANKNGSSETGDWQQVLVSPDGSRYAIMLVHADIAANGNWLEVVGGQLTSLENAAKIKTAARLFTTSLGTRLNYGASSLTLPGLNVVGWTDNETIAFLWERLGNGHTNNTIQIVSVNTQNGTVRWLSDHPTSVTRFDIGLDGLILYSAPPARDEGASARLLRHGFAVETPDAYGVLLGELESPLGPSIAQSYILDSKQPVPRAITAGGSSVNTAERFESVHFSPNGRLAIMSWAADQLPASWMDYDDSLLKRKLEGKAGAYGRSEPEGVPQLHVLDIESAHARPLWNAPEPLVGSRVAWAPNSKSMIVARAYLPIAAENRDRGDHGYTAAEVNVETGSFEELPGAELPTISTVRIVWRGNDCVEIVYADGQISTYLKTNGKWALSRGPYTPEASARTGVQIEVRQSIHTPPLIVARDTKLGVERVVMDPTPQLRNGFELGDVQETEWHDRNHRAWRGRIYYPIRYNPKKRYPLVIQTSMPARKNMYSLFGGGDLGLGASYAVYAAQVLAGQGIAVLQLEETSTHHVAATTKEAQLYSIGYEDAAMHFVRAGLALEGKIGLVGYSRSGWYVEYALAHSKFAYQAAVVVDNFDGGYFQAALSGWKPEFAWINGAPPFGDGLHSWLEASPAFNVENFQTPLQIQVHGAGVAGVMNAWEMYSRLRQLELPAELYVIPDVDHGSHGIQNPRQCLAAHQRAVAWFDFWLNGSSVIGETKRQRFERWRKLIQEPDRVSRADP